MAIVITNGNYFIRYTANMGARFTPYIDEAYEFPNIQNAVYGMNQAPGKTEGFFVYDTETERVCWKRMPPEELKLIREGKKEFDYRPPKPVRLCKSTDNKSRNTKTSSLKKKYGKALYHQADCRCQLCGRKITYQDATVDHIMPKAMGGVNDVSNLQIACYACNQLKGSVLPDSFMQRVSDIFMYQMSKKFSNRFAWKIASVALRKLQKA